MNSLKEDTKNGYTEIYSWGSDRFGQLGLGNKVGAKNFLSPTYYSFNIIIKMISSGEEHSAFITSSGTIFTIGSNSEGRLGIGDRTIKQSSSPCLVETLSKIPANWITCGWGHTAAILENGDLYTWGVGEYGALGIPGNSSQWLPIKVQFSNKEKIWITNVSTGTRHTAAIDEKGKLFTFGSGEAGQLGTGLRKKEEVPFQISSITEKLTQVACGVFHTLVLTQNGKLYGMGGNNFGQLGIGTKRSTTIPIKIAELETIRIVKISAGQFSSAISDNGDLYTWGTSTFGEFLKPKKMENIKTSFIDVSIGGSYCITVDLKGQVFCWGNNTSGELGLGDNDPRTKLTLIEALKDKKVAQVAAGGSYCIALGKTIYKNMSGLIKLDDEYMPNDKSPIPIQKRKEDSYRSSKEINDSQRMGLNISKSSFISKDNEESNMEKNYPINAQKVGINYQIDSRIMRSRSNYGQKTPIPSNAQSKIKANYELLNTQLTQRLNMKEETKKEKEKERYERTKEEIPSSEIIPDQKIYYPSSSSFANTSIKDGEFIRIKENLKNYENEMINLKFEINQYKIKADKQNKENDFSRSKIQEMNNQIKTLESIVNSQRSENNSLQEEITRIKSSQNTMNNSKLLENSKIKELLKEYDEKIVAEVEAKHKIMVEKTNEINELNDTIVSLESRMEAKQDELIFLEEKYSKELKTLESKSTILEDELKKYKEEILIIKELNKENKNKIEVLSYQLDSKNAELTNEKDNNIGLNRLYQEAKEKLDNKENELNELRRRLDDQKNALIYLESEYKIIKEDADKLPIISIENENLQTTINNLREENGSLLTKIHLQEDEIDNSNKEIISWKQIVDKLGKENNELKFQIENLEEKNKKLVETLNLNIYNKATEYKERTVRQLRLSNSPKRIHKILSSRKNIPYSKLSPERLEGIINKDIKSNDIGIKSIKDMKIENQAPPPFKLYEDEISQKQENQKK